MLEDNYWKISQYILGDKMLSRIFITVIIYLCGISAVRSSKNTEELPQRVIDSYMKRGIFGNKPDEIQKKFYRFNAIVGIILLIANTLQLLYFNRDQLIIRLFYRK